MAMTTGPKFIIVDDDKMRDVEASATHPYALWLTDYLWYNAHKQALELWIQEHDVEMQGMIIKFCTEQERTLFILRWQ
jgi:hypothetical protein